MSEQRMPVAIVGSGNIGTDLLVKIVRTSTRLELVAMAGIDPASDGLALASRAGVATTSDGVDGLLALPRADELGLVFDATSAHAHQRNWELLEPHGIRVLDLTPAAIGPYCVPVVNLDAHLDAPNLNMVTCGGQATVPIVAAVGTVGTVRYAEIVSSIASRSAGPGTRSNIDEFTDTTAAALVEVGGAEHGKAVIVLNPAEPPLMMRNTVYCLVEGRPDVTSIEGAIDAMVARVAAYVPGFRLKQRPQFEHLDSTEGLAVPGIGSFAGTKVTVLLEVTGAAHHLPAYAGNLDIMTSAALATAERLAERSAFTSLQKEDR